MWYSTCSSSTRLSGPTFKPFGHSEKIAACSNHTQCKSPTILSLSTIYSYLILFCFCAIFLFYVITRSWKPVSPQEQFRSFASSAPVVRDLMNIADIPVDKLEYYSEACCVEGETAEDVRLVLNERLGRIPEPVRMDIIYGAVLEGMSTTNTVQNVLDGNEDGSVFSYTAFWSTLYDYHSARREQAYVT